MKKIIDWYHLLLTWLMVATGRDPDRAGHAADRLALHRVDSVVDLD
jgi:hypothetical protein